MVTSLKEKVYSQREQILSFMRSPLNLQCGNFTKGNRFLTDGADYFINESPPWTFNMLTSHSQKGQIISLVRSPLDFNVVISLKGRVYSKGDQIFYLRFV